MHHAQFYIALGAASVVALACSSTERSHFEEAEVATEPSFALPTEESTPAPPPCVATQTKAEHPAVDIVVVIDTSGSMDEETAQVKQNINAFAHSIGGGGLDYNVIMIARKPSASGSSFGICVPPPLAGANCADTVTFHHLDILVDSTNSLRLLLDQYPNYAKWLRASA
jgi:hypothetical protein